MVAQFDSRADFGDVLQGFLVDGGARQVVERKSLEQNHGVVGQKKLGVLGLCPAMKMTQYDWPNFMASAFEGHGSESNSTITYSLSSLNGGNFWQRQLEKIH